MSKDETFVQIFKIVEAGFLIGFTFINLIILNEIRILLLKIIELLGNL